MELVSVIIPAYNSEDHIEEAVLSICNQTYKNLQIIVINDGSRDKTLEKLKRLQREDPRIEIYSQDNQGLIATLNRAISLCKGNLIARMDADDISLPERINKQVNLFNNNPKLVCCSVSTEDFGDSNTLVIRSNNNDYLKALLLFWPPFCHPGAMYKRDLIQSHNIQYNQDFKHCEDFAFWSDLASLGEFSNCSEVLLKYRVHASQVTAQYSEAVLENHRRVCNGNLSKLGVQISKEDFLPYIGKKKHPKGFVAITSVYLSILESNKRHKVYSNAQLKLIIKRLLAKQVADFYGIKGLVGLKKLGFKTPPRLILQSIRRDLVKLVKKINPA